MRVFRGQGVTLDADTQVTDRIIEQARRRRERALRVWAPHKHVSFGPRDVSADGYEFAREAAEERGYPVTTRAVGGRPVAFTGTTVAFVHLRPDGDTREGIDVQYEETIEVIQRALDRLGIDATRGEPPGAFCPGTHALQTDGKLVGLAQRVYDDAVLVAGVIVVRDHDAIASVLERVYAAFNLELDPDAIGSIAKSGGDANPERVARVVEEELVGETATTIESVDS